MTEAEMERERQLEVAALDWISTMFNKMNQNGVLRIKFTKDETPTGVLYLGTPDEYISSIYSEGPISLIWSDKLRPVIEELARHKQFKVRYNNTGSIFWLVRP